jgi:hypothetical protein
MPKSRLILLLLSSVFLFLSLLHGQDVSNELLNKIPSNSGCNYRCKDMIHVVNHLRHLGKDKALKVLNTYVAEFPPVTPENVLLVCRLLFVKTNGWDILVPGVPEPAVNTNAFELFPLFPIAISEGIPFELVSGYHGDGFFGNPPKSCVKLCENLSIITSDLSAPNYEAAARELIQSKEFQQLYQNPVDERKMAEMVLLQAGQQLNSTRQP